MDDRSEGPTQLPAVPGWAAGRPLAWGASTAQHGGLSSKHGCDVCRQFSRIISATGPLSARRDPLISPSPNLMAQQPVNDFKKLVEQLVEEDEFEEFEVEGALD